LTRVKVSKSIVITAFEALYNDCFYVITIKLL
jgi:hypothetical protein